MKKVYSFNHRFMSVIQDAAALFRQLHAVVDGLTAAAGAAAGTGHDLHEVIAHLAPLQGGHELAGVQQAAGHCHGPVSVAQNRWASFWQK